MTAVNGTQTTIKTRSAAASPMMRMLVVLRMFLLATTTTITDKLPTKPSAAMRPNMIGMMMRTKYSKTTLVLGSVEQLAAVELLTQATSPSDSIVVAPVVTRLSVRDRDSATERSELTACSRVRRPYVVYGHSAASAAAAARSAASPHHRSTRHNTTYDSHSSESLSTVDLVR